MLRRNSEPKPELASCAVLGSSGDGSDEAWLKHQDWALAAQKAGLYSLRGGLGSLSQALGRELQTLPEVEILTETSVDKIRVTREGLQLELSGGGGGLGALEADHVFSAVPAFSLAELLRRSGDAPCPASAIGEPETVAGLLETGVPYAGIAVANFGFGSQVLPHEGFGHLVPYSQQVDARGGKSPVLGVVYDSSVFPGLGPDQPHTRVSVMMGGARHGEAFRRLGEDSEAWLGVAREGLYRHLGVDASKVTATPHPPHLSAFSPQHMVSDSLSFPLQAEVSQVEISPRAIPQYQVGHIKRKRVIQDAIDHEWDGRLTVVGSALHGISVNDCVGSGREAAATYVTTQGGESVEGLSPKELAMRREIQVLRRRASLRTWQSDFEAAVAAQ